MKTSGVQSFQANVQWADGLWVGETARDYWVETRARPGGAGGCSGWLSLSLQLETLAGIRTELGQPCSNRTRPLQEDWFPVKAITVRQEAIAGLSFHSAELLL